MYIAAPDDIYNVIVPTDKGNINDIGMGPLPSLTGTPAGSLSGGNDYMFAKQDTPAQIKAGIKCHRLRGPDARRGEFNFARQKADGFPVGFAEPELFGGAAGTKVNAAPGRVRDDQRVVLPVVSSTRNEASDGEPFDAQAVYKTLDPMMLAVLTEPNVNIPALLKTAATNVNTHAAIQRGISGKPGTVRATHH